jgi:hypothetical protein
LLTVGIVALIVVACFVAYSQFGQTEQAAQAAQQSSAGQTVDPAPAAALGPHPQENLPPLPVQAYPPPRSMAVVNATYRFAAEHPEVLSYVPCFCGCERAGHRGNEDCFVKTRNEKGDVTEWDPHGLDCAVCLDVANESMQMHRSGASVREIRSAIEKKGATPTRVTRPRLHHPRRRSRRPQTSSRMQRDHRIDADAFRAGITQAASATSVKAAATAAYVNGSRTGRRTRGLPARG